MSYRISYRRLVFEIVEVLKITIEPAHPLPPSEPPSTAAKGCSAGQKGVATPGAPETAPKSSG